MHEPKAPRDAGHATLQTFLDLARQDTPPPPLLESTLDAIRRVGLAETALRELKVARPRSNSAKDPVWRTVRERLETMAEATRAKRQHDWQLDPGRRTLRLAFELRAPACGLNPAALGHALAGMMTGAGLPMAHGLEKRPRPCVALGPPLPLGVAGLREWADIVLSEPLRQPLDACRALLNAEAPDGLQITALSIVSSHGSPLLELARVARWRWQVPPELLDVARQRMALFAAAERFEIAKTGKQDGAKTVKLREIRSLVTALAWEGDALHFTTRLAPGEAPSALKLLAGILAIDPNRITGLTRLEVILGEDARLAQAAHFEPKLHNMWEDAVLLESADGIQVEDEDDDELLLGR